MNNNDNCEFVYNIERQIRETEEEFIYTIIKPFCETVVEKKLSKAELKQILKRGMQKSISLDKLKQAREEIQDNYEGGNHADEFSDGYDVAINDCIKILDKLIESEG